MKKPVSESEMLNWNQCLLNPSAKLVDRARALWGLRHADEPLALDLIASFVRDYTAPSPVANELLQHEAAYCLGQKGNPKAIPHLVHVLRNIQHTPIVRHEAAEALAALCGREGVCLSEVEAVLQEYAGSDVIEVAETCQVGLGRIDWLKKIKSESPDQKTQTTPDSDIALQFFPNTVDPSPCFGQETTYSLEDLRDILLDSSQNLFNRYRALFTLRNRVLEAVSKGQSPDKPALYLSQGLSASGSALLRHEVAFVLGQLVIGSTLGPLADCVQSVKEHPMVRHEAAEALGSVIGELESHESDTGNSSTDSHNLLNKARNILSQFVSDKEPIVRESCVLALDVADYVSSADQFQYAFVPVQ